ncbi:MAG: hypothetical protein E6K72_06680 [Candidatus Eisenbacteria bacterium]|uniref:ATP-dependent helicase C-terminal domain-containing protein n=1 Tax=Eiseniibacteriota bacterium TaxID=2212470 RepID=A0A538SV42_UNCEI|nr:MAG: hypothetical protein E6K72_06680 [Candidatus Eisenbacteria bacterium]
MRHLSVAVRARATGRELHLRWRRGSRGCRGGGDGARARHAAQPARALHSAHAPRPRARRFRAERGAVLLGVQSLWEGVDFPGAALEILVVAKLPFSVPDDPLVQARGERLRERGLDPFRADSLPEAVLRFRQGIGRLIRRDDDRGVLVVCDPRLNRASYRAGFLTTLPSEWRSMSDAEALAKEAARFLDRPHAVEERT